MSFEYIFYFCFVNYFAILLLIFVLSILNSYLYIIFHLALFHGLFSVVVIESAQFYILEQNSYGELKYSAAFLLVSLIIYYSAWMLGEFLIHGKNKEVSISNNRIILKKNEYLEGFLNLYFLIFCVFFILAWLVNILSNWPPPLLVEEGIITRFIIDDDADFFKGKTFTFIPLILGYISPRSNREVKLVVLISLIIYFIIMLLCGQKFGGFVFGLFYYYAGRFADKVFLIKLDMIKYFKFISIVGVVSSLIVSLIYYHYISLAPLYGMDPVDLFIQRVFVLQGQLWYAVDKLAADFDGYNLDTSFSYSSFMIGMMSIADPMLDLDAVYNGMSGKFTYGFPTVLTFIFGRIPMLFLMSFFGLATALVLNIVRYLVKEGGILNYLSALYLYIVVADFFSAGEFFSLINFKSLTIYFFSIICIINILLRKSQIIRSDTSGFI